MDLTGLIESEDVVLLDGANCGDVDPRQMAEIVFFMRSAVSVPLVAQPNAGRPKLIAGETVFDMGPDPFADGVEACLREGASIVGGCCGTSPEHIRAVADRLAEQETERHSG